MSLTHRDLADLTAALYNAPTSVPWLYLSNPDANVVFAVIRRGKYLIVIIRGSYTEMDWIHDVLVREMNPIGRPSILRVHSGFYGGTPEATDIIRMIAEEGDIIVIAAHSLGAGRGEIEAEHLAAIGLPIAALVTWGRPAPFKPSAMPAPTYAATNYRNVDGNSVDEVTYSTDIVGYRHRTPFTDLAVKATGAGPFALHHFALYQTATPATEITP